MAGPRIKICGVTTAADAALAARLGADAVGLNFYPGSPRAVSEQTARAIVAALPPFVEPVGVFVNESFDSMRAVAQRLQMRTVQLHGERIGVPPSDGYRYLPAFAVRDRASLIALDAYLEMCRVAGQMPAAILVDSHVAGAYGGTGQRAPWDLLADYRPIVPLILAGGLTPDNVAEAVRRVRPWAVDVASGVESGPGVKEAEKMRRFIEAVRLV
jgi:phosphoribosylanthranilate isomerase